MRTLVSFAGEIQLLLQYEIERNTKIKQTS